MKHLLFSLMILLLGVLSQKALGQEPAASCHPAAPASTATAD